MNSGIREFRPGGGGRLPAPISLFSLQGNRSFLSLFSLQDACGFAGEGGGRRAPGGGIRAALRIRGDWTEEGGVCRISGGRPGVAASFEKVTSMYVGVWGSRGGQRAPKKNEEEEKTRKMKRNRRRGGRENIIRGAREGARA